MVEGLGVFFGSIFRAVYDLVSSGGPDPANISFYAISIIIVTILLRIFMLPLFIKQNKEMQKMASVQPKINEIQKKYKDDPNVMNQKLMKLMQEEKYNPMGGCLPMLINIPIIMGFWRMMQSPEVYIFKDGIFDSINNNFLWIDNLKDPDLWILPLVCAGATLLSSKLAQKNQVQTQVGEQAQTARQMNEMMMYMFPVMIFFMSRKFASGLALYWAVSNIFQVIQSTVLNKTVDEVREEALEGAKEAKNRRDN